MDSEIKVCQSCKAQFTVEPDDFAFYETIKVPPPTWCLISLIRTNKGYKEISARIEYYLVTWMQR